MRRIPVLVALDPDDDSRPVENALRRGAFHPLIAESTAEVLAIARSRRPPIVLLEISRAWDRFPGASFGLEAIGVDYHPRVVVVTSLDEALAGLSAGNRGFEVAHYLVRPFTPQLLLDVVRQEAGWLVDHEPALLESRAGAFGRGDLRGAPAWSRIESGNHSRVPLARMRRGRQSSDETRTSAE